MEENRKLNVNGYRVLFENVLKLIVVMVIQLWEYTKNNFIVHFKWNNFMVCEFYLNKAVITRNINTPDRRKYDSPNTARIASLGILMPSSFTTTAKG